MKHTFEPNQDWLQKQNPEHISRWAKALREAHASPSLEQAHRAMYIDADARGIEAMCCLMVAHVAFGGKKKGLGDNMLPSNKSSVIANFGSRDPHIAIVSSDAYLEETTCASDLNDGYELSFEQIADLLEGKMVTT